MQQAQQPFFDKGFNCSLDLTRVSGLYIHIPFCFHKCHYCDFYSIVDSDSRNEDKQLLFFNALAKELLHINATRPLQLRTIFIGGGTPTLLRIDIWEKIFDLLHQNIQMSQIQEFTVEANPETVSSDLMRLFVQQGVNRLSIGAQSFNPKLLKTLERWHDPANVARAVDCARSAGISFINLDMIFAIPGQTAADLQNDLDTALSLNPDHLSDYSLIFEPNTPLTKKKEMGRILPLAEDTERSMFQYIIETLQDRGFDHYEISNWAKLPYSDEKRNKPLPAWRNRCLHNLLYWGKRKLVRAWPLCRIPH